MKQEVFLCCFWWQSQYWLYRQSQISSSFQSKNSDLFGGWGKVPKPIVYVFIFHIKVRQGKYKLHQLLSLLINIILNKNIIWYTFFSVFALNRSDIQLNTQRRIQQRHIFTWWGGGITKTILTVIGSVVNIGRSMIAWTLIWFMSHVLSQKCVTWTRMVRGVWCPVVTSDNTIWFFQGFIMVGSGLTGSNGVMVVAELCAVL